MQDIFNRDIKTLKDVLNNIANRSFYPALPWKVANKTSCLPDYIYPCDNYIDIILNNSLMRKILREIATQYYGKQIKEVIANGTRLRKKNFPILWKNYQHCCDTLHIENIPSTYITTKLSGINAFSAESANEAVILLSPQVAIRLTESEQCFLLGHELGHIQQGHLAAHSIQGLLHDLNKRVELLGLFTKDLLNAPLNRWYRISEFTADRAGFLCSHVQVGTGLFRRIRLAIGGDLLHTGQ